MAAGGGAGAFFLILLSTYARLPVAWILALPGVGVACGSALFSSRRSSFWGALSAGLGVTLTVFVLWLRAPTRIGIVALARQLVLTFPGALHILIILVAAIVIGAGRDRPLVGRPTPERES
jgi:hypothetical protein